MNERIRELVKQATTIEEHKWGVSYDNFNKEKFAELIIKETLQIARVGMEFGPSMDEAVYTYFGIEE